MKQKLIDYFSKIIPLTEEEARAILDSMVTRQFRKGEILLREGQVSAEVYFVLEGCVRQYYVKEGEEVTNGFFTEDQWVISINSLSQKTPADHYWVCSEDSTLVIGNEQKENDLYSRFPRFETISRKVMERVFGEQQELNTSYFMATPEERYLKLMETRPDLFQRIPQYQIASYIGVKPESLSRIRRRIR